MFLCIGMHVCCMCVCMCMSTLCTLMCWLEVTSGVFLTCPPPCSLRHGLSVEVRAVQYGLYGQPACFRIPCLLPECWITGGLPCPLGIYVDSGCKNSGPPIFLAITLPTEPSCQPYVKIIILPTSCYGNYMKDYARTILHAQ